MSEDRRVYVSWCDWGLVGVFRERPDAIDAIKQILPGLTTDEIEKQLSRSQFCAGYDRLFDEKTCVWLKEGLIE